MILVVYTKKIDGGHSPSIDGYTTADNMSEAKLLYAKLLEEDDTYIASICAVVKSTDYDPTTSQELIA